jgi:hypothetical protein
MEDLAKLFSLEYDSESKLIRRVPVFNYEYVLSPPDFDEMAKILKNLPSKDSANGNGADYSNKTASDHSYAAAEEDIPF